MSFKHVFAQGVIGFKVALQYRFNFVITMITAPLSVLIYYFLWKAIYAYTQQEVIRGFTLPSLIQYYVLSMIVGFFAWCEIDKWMSQDIRRGHIITMFIAPMSFLLQHLSFEIGVNALAIVLEMIPVFAIGIVFFGLEIASAFNIITFLVSVALGFFITFFVAYFLGLTAFWFKEITGLRRVRRTLVVFLSGGMIPLSFFPSTLQKISHFLPFEYIRYVPIKIYLGDYSTLMVLGQLGLQIAWIAALFIFTKWFFQKAYKQFTGAGV
jgi:ABC-2 type transport system permease protein